MRPFATASLARKFSSAISALELYSHAVAICIALVLVSSGTFFMWQFASDAAEENARVRFDARVNQIAEAVRGRMVDYEQVLRGGVGLFAASKSVERSEWRAYVEHLRIESIYPGIQAIGFVPRVRAAEKSAYMAAVRKEGFADYEIRPLGERPEYAPVDFVEPFNGRNLRAFGFDMLSEAARRVSLDRARDTGQPAVTGRVTLVQETDENPQAGFIMFVPVYRAVMDTSSVSERRAALIGYIYSPFRMDDLMRGILGTLDDVRLRIVDAGPGKPQLLYDSRPGGKDSIDEAIFNSTVDVMMRGRVWKLEVGSLAAFNDTVDRTGPVLVASITGAVGIILLGFFLFLSSARARAMRLARSMTRDLRDSRERLALAIEGSSQAMFDWDLTTGKVVLSEQWAIITGGGPESLSTTAAALQASVHPDDQPMVAEKIRELLRGGLPFYHAEHRVRTTMGWRWISSRAKVVERDAKGRAVRVAGTNMDITDLKEVERLKAEFVSTVSHELRTPLTALIGSLGLLDRQAAGKLAPDAAMFLGMAKQNGERLAALINNILDMEKMESGRMDFRFEPVDIRPLLERAVALNAPYAEKLGVRFELGAAEDAVVTGDEDRLLQVLTNLMSNGAKYSPKGAPVTVSASKGDGVVRLSVADRGPGVPDEFRDRIFGKFAQADGSDTRSKGGTGLGLSISRSIVEKLGGKMGFESVRGKGATFYFELPLRRDG